ncbi:MAG: helix-turn-helix transcriptional regulator [Pseudomonadota bacterium]
MAPDLYQTLGRRIAELRRTRTFSQEQLAERAGVGPSYIARIEAGTRRPTLDVLGHIASALEVPLIRLIAEEQASAALDIGTAKALLEEVRDLPARDLELLMLMARRLRDGPATTQPSGSTSTVEGWRRGHSGKPRRS